MSISDSRVSKYAISSLEYHSHTQSPKKRKKGCTNVLVNKSVVFLAYVSLFTADVRSSTSCSTQFYELHARCSRGLMPF